MDTDKLIKYYKEFTNPRGKGFGEMAGELDGIYPEIKNEIGVKELTKFEKNPKDWEEFDVFIKLDHRKIIPSFHNFEFQYSKESHNNLCIRYEYYFEYKIELILDKNEAFDFVYSYVMSIVFTHLYYPIKYQRERKIKDTPFIGGLLSKLLINDRVDSMIEGLHREHKNKIENYINEKLDDIDMRNKKKCWDKFFEGVPERHRGMWINM